MTAVFPTLKRFKFVELNLPAFYEESDADLRFELGIQELIRLIGNNYQYGLRQALDYFQKSFSLGKKCDI
jgi:hypothetical protein